MEELGEEIRLTTDDANPAKVDMQALNTPFDGQLEKRKTVRTFRYDMRYFIFSGQKVKPSQYPGRIGT